MAFVSVVSFLAGMYAKPEGRIIEPVINLTCEKPVVNVPECPEGPACNCYQTACSQPQIISIAQDLANEKNYSTEYNCEQFSQELQRRYNNLGYETYYCTGIAKWCMKGEKNSYDCRHAWVKVCSYVEATNGRFIGPEEFEKNYSLSKCER